MTHVQASLHVRVPRELARQHLCDMLVEGSDSGSPHSLRLTVILPWTGIELAKDVNVEYTLATGPAHINEPIGIRWTPQPGGIYPSFGGEMRVLAGNHSDSSILELEGDYTPPLGKFGMEFDAAVGHRVAEATMAHLLEGLASGIVARHKSDKWRETWTPVSHEEHVQNRARVIKGTAVIVRPALPPPR